MDTELCITPTQKSLGQGKWHHTGCLKSGNDIAINSSAVKHYHHCSLCILNTNVNCAP